MPLVRRRFVARLRVTSRLRWVAASRALLLPGEYLAKDQPIVETNVSKAVGSATAVTSTAGYFSSLSLADPRVRDVVQAALDLATCVEAVERRRL